MLLTQLMGINGPGSCHTNLGLHRSASLKRRQADQSILASPWLICGTPLGALCWMIFRGLCKAFSRQVPHLDQRTQMMAGTILSLLPERIQNCYIRGTREKLIHYIHAWGYQGFILTGADKGWRIAGIANQS